MKWVYFAAGLVALPFYLRLMYWLTMNDIERREKRDAPTELHLDR